MTPIQRVLVYTFVTALSTPLSSLAGEIQSEISEKNLNTNSSSMSLHSIEGKLLKIDGEFYVVEDHNGQHIRVHVGERTVLLNGAKKPGDSVRAMVKKDGLALTVK